MFNFIVNSSECGSSTTARIIDGDVISVFCFMNTDRGLDTVGGVTVSGECVRSNFTQHYSGHYKGVYDTDSCAV